MKTHIRIAQKLRIKRRKKKYMKGFLRTKGNEKDFITKTERQKSNG